VKAAGLVDTLKGSGFFTVFAKTNEAFAKLPAGTVENLLKPESKDALAKVLTYHVVPGRLSALDLKKQIKAGNGQAELKTMSGGTLTVMMQGKNIVLKDEKGGVSTVTFPNVFQSNGVIHVVDAVVLPNILPWKSTIGTPEGERIFSLLPANATDSVGREASQPLLPLCA